VKQVAALALSLALLGCSEVDHPGSSYQVYLDPKFTTEQQGQVIAGAQAWVDQTQNSPHPLSVTFNIADVTCDNNCYGVITVHAWTAEQMKVFRNGPRDEYGNTERVWQYRLLSGENGSSDYSNIYMDIDQPAHWFQQTATHEVGHALALQHTGEGTLMCAYTSCAAHEITSADVQQYNDLRR